MTFALQASGICKRYGALWANRDIAFAVERGGVHAVVGENGAGKSTLMRGLYGLDPPDAGSVKINGKLLRPHSVHEAMRRGLGMVHQHFMLVPTLTVVQNLVLGREPRRGPFLDLTAAADEIYQLGEKYGLAVDPQRRVSTLSVGEAQRVELIKVLWRGADILILDEPTAVLTSREVEQLFATLRRLSGDGKTILLVTHKLDEVMALASQVTVLRRGEVVLNETTAQLTAAVIAEKMIGRTVQIAAPYAPSAQRLRQPRLQLEALSVDREDGVAAIRDLSLQVSGGEIFGIAGVEGNGQSELALSVAGLLAIQAGKIQLDGVDCSAWDVAARRRAKIAFVPEDRAQRGLFAHLDLAENLRLGLAGGSWPLRRQLQLAATQQAIERFDIRPAQPTAAVEELSGGNQQKLLMARELQGVPSVLICAQPTRGVDLGAIEQLHLALRRVRDAGCAILLFSAEIDELLSLSDKIAVLSRGRLVATFDNQAAERETLRQKIAAHMTSATTSATVGRAS